MELFKLFGSILVDSDAAENSISKTGDKADGLGAKLGKGIGVAAKFGAALVAGAGVAGAGMLALVNKTANAADEIDKLSERTGINREELQRWKYAAGQSGADIGKLETGIKKLSDVMDEAANGNEKATEGFNKLGISMDDLKNKSQEQIFEETMKALADMEEGAERNALGNDLLGKSYTEMLPLLNAGSDGMQALKDRADELGIVMSEDAVKANVVYGDTMDDLKQSFGAVFMEMSNNFLPVLQKMMDWALKNMPTFKEYVKTAMDGAGEALKAVGGYIKDNIIPSFQALWDWIQPNIPAIKETISVAFDAIEVVFGKVKDAVKFVADNMNILLPIVIGLTGAVVAQMVINSLVGAYKAWQTATKTQTALQWLLNIALNANPLGLVALAIGAVIAIGILLWKNWDTIKAKTIELWSMITEKFTDIKNSVVNKVNELKVAAVAKFAELVLAGRTRFIELKNAIMNPIETARDKIKGVIETIKGFFANLKLKLPNIKTPHFKFSNWSMNPLDWVKKMPSIGIDWYAKGGVFNKPTLFDTASGIKGVGEAGPEAVLPLNESVLGMIGQKIADTMSQSNSDNKPIILQTFLDRRMIAEVIHDDMSQLMGNRNNLDFAMKGVT